MLWPPLPGLATFSGLPSSLKKHWQWKSYRGQEYLLLWIHNLSAHFLKAPSPPQSTCELILLSCLKGDGFINLDKLWSIMNSTCLSLLPLHLRHFQKIAETKIIKDPVRIWIIWWLSLKTVYFDPFIRKRVAQNYLLEIEEWMFLHKESNRGKSEYWQNQKQQVNSFLGSRHLKENLLFCDEQCIQLSNLPCPLLWCFPSFDSFCKLTVSHPHIFHIWKSLHLWNSSFLNNVPWSGG